MRIVAIALVAFALAGCVQTAVTPLSQNQFMLNTSAAPICGTRGSADVASRMAAVETLRRGYDRYIIQGAQSENNVRTISTAPTGSYTTGTVTGMGNTAYGTAQTTYFGGGPMVTGTRDTNLVVLMLRPGEAGYNNALDARSILGPEWQQIASEGIRSC